MPPDPTFHRHRVRRTRPVRPVRRAGLAGPIAALAACLLVLVPVAPAGAGEPAPQRVSEAAIGADRRHYEAMQARIRALNDRGVRIDDYALAKAQCWLDTSFHEYTRNDRGGYPQAALDEAARIVAALEEGRAPGRETPLVNGAERLREDLWRRFAVLRDGPGAPCAAQAVACGEVELVHAGNEIHDGGWRHARPYIQIAEDLLARAGEQAARCAADTPPATAATPLAAPPGVATEVVERFELEASALFAFDRGDEAGLLPEGRVKLDVIARHLARSAAAVEHLLVAGHTDRLGSAAYNRRLALERARTVRQYLRERGVGQPIRVEGVGAGQPTGRTAHCTGDRATPALAQCLAPDRRVTVEVYGVRRSHPRGR